MTWFTSSLSNRLTVVLAIFCVAGVYVVFRYADSYTRTLFGICLAILAVELFIFTRR